MIAIPAIEVRGGVCVPPRMQDDPLAAAHAWTRFGFSRLHLWDGDAALSRGDNGAVVQTILDEYPAHIQIGGGVATDTRAEHLLTSGAHMVIVVAHAVPRDWLVQVATLYPGKIGVAIDVRERRAVGAQADVIALVEELANIPVAAIIVTSVQRRGTMQGADVNLLGDIVRASDAPVIAAGGIGRRRDLDDLTDCGIIGAIIGTALCNGTLEPGLLAEEYGG